MDETRLAAEIAARLRAERARLDWTQAEAGKRAGLSWMTVHRYEAGDRPPTVAALYKLAAAYGVEATALLPPMATVEDLKPRRKR